MIAWSENKKFRLLIRAISVVIIQAFLMYDITWATGGEIGAHKLSPPSIFQQSFPDEKSLGFKNSVLSNIKFLSAALSIGACIFVDNLPVRYVKPVVEKEFSKNMEFLDGFDLDTIKNKDGVVSVNYSKDGRAYIIKVCAKEKLNELDKRNSHWTTSDRLGIQVIEVGSTPYDEKSSLSDKRGKISEEMDILKQTVIRVDEELVGLENEKRMIDARLNTLNEEKAPEYSRIKTDLAGLEKRKAELRTKLDEFNGKRTLILNRIEALKKNIEAIDKEIGILEANRAVVAKQKAKESKIASPEKITITPNIHHDGLLYRFLLFLRRELRPIIVVAMFLIFFAIPNTANAAKFEILSGPTSSQHQIVATVEKGDTPWNISGQAKQGLPNTNIGKGKYAPYLQWSGIYEANPQIHNRPNNALRPMYEDGNYYKDDRHIILDIRPGDKLVIPAPVNYEALGLKAPNTIAETKSPAPEQGEQITPDVQKKVDEVQAEKVNIQQQLDEAKIQAEKAEKEKVSQTEQLTQSAEQLKQAQEKITSLEKEASAQQTELSQKDQELGQAQDKIKSLEEQKQAIEEKANQDRINLEQEHQTKLKELTNPSNIVVNRWNEVSNFYKVLAILSLLLLVGIPIISLLYASRARKREAALRGEINRLQRGFESDKNKIVEDYESKITGLNAELEAQKRQIEEITNDRERIHRDLEGVKEELKAAKDGLEALKSKPADKIEEAQLQALQATIENLTAGRDNLNNEIAVLESRNTALQVENGALTAGVAQLRQDENGLTQNIAELEQRSEGVTSEIAKKQKEIEELTAGQAQQKQTLSDQIASLEKTKSELNTQIQNLSTKRDDIEKQITALSAKKASAEKDSQILQSQVEDLNRTISSLTSQIEEQRKEQESLKSEITRLKEEGERLISIRETETVLREELGRVREELESVRSKLSTLETEKNEYETQVRELNDQKQKLEEKIVSQEETMAGLAEQVATLTDQVERLIEPKELVVESIVGEEPDKAEEKLKEIERLNTQIQDLSSQVEAKNKEFDSTKQEKEALDNEVSSLTSGRDVLQNQVTQLTQQLENLTEQIKNQNQRVADVTQQLDAISKEKEGTQEEVELLRTETQRGQVELNSITTQKDILTQRLDGIGKDIEQAQQQLQIIKTDIAELGFKKEGLDIKIADLTTQKESLENALPGLIQEKANLENEIASLREVKKELSALDALIAQRKQEATDLNQQIFRLNNSIEEKEARLKGLETRELEKKSVLMVEIKDLKNRIEELKTQKAGLERDVEIASELKDKSKEEIEVALKGETDRIQQEILTLTADLDKLNQSKTQYESDITALEGRKKIIEEVLALGQKEVNDFTDKAEDLKRQIEELAREKDKKETDNGEMTATISRLTVETQEMINKLERERQESEARQKEKGALDKEIDQLTLQKDNISKQARELERNLQDIAAQIASQSQILEALNQEAGVETEKKTEAEQRLKDLEAAIDVRQQELNDLITQKDGLAQGIKDARTAIKEADQRRELLQAELKKSETQKQNLAAEVGNLIEEKNALEGALPLLREEKARLDTEIATLQKKKEAIAVIDKTNIEQMLYELIDNIPAEDSNIWDTLNSMYPFKDSKIEITRMLIGLAKKDENLRMLIEKLHDNLSHDGRIKEEDMVSRGDYEQFKIRAKLNEDFDKTPQHIENGLRFTNNNREYRLALAPRDILDLISGYISADCTDPGFANGMPFLKYVPNHIQSPGFLKFRLYVEKNEDSWTWVGNIYTAVAEDKKSEQPLPILIIDALQLPYINAGPFQTEPKPIEINLPFKNPKEAAEVADKVMETLIKYAKNAGFRQVWLGFISNFYEPKGGLVKHFQEKYAKEYSKTIPPLHRENRASKIKPTNSEVAYQNELAESGLDTVGVDKNVLDSFPRTTDRWTWRGFAKIWSTEEIISLPVEAKPEAAPEEVKAPSEVTLKPSIVKKIPSLLVTDIDNILSENIAEMFKDGNPRTAPREVIDKLLYLAEQGTLIALITSQSFAEVNRFFLSQIPKEKRPLLRSFTIYTSCSAQCLTYEPQQDKFILRYDKFKGILPGININDIAKAIQAKLKGIKIDSEIIFQDKISKSDKVVIHERGASISIASIPEKKRREISDAISDFINDGWFGALASHKSSTASVDIFVRTLNEFINKPYGKAHFLGLAKEQLGREIQPNEILTIGYDFTDDVLDRDMIIQGANNYSVGTSDNDSLAFYPTLEAFESNTSENVSFFGEGGDKGWQRTNELLRRIIEGEPAVSKAEIKPEAKKTPYSLMLLDIDDTLSENITGMFKDGKPRYVPDDIVKHLISFAEQGVLIALITAQSFGEVNRFLISRIPREKEVLLKNFIIYSSSSADCWTYREKHRVFDLVYNKFSDESNGLFTINVANEIQKDLKGPFGIGGLKTTVVSQADIPQCSGSIIHDRGAQLSIGNIPSDKLEQVIKKVERLIQKRGWPLYVTGIARHSFHVLVKDIDKSFGRKNFLQFAKERLGREIPASEILVVGNSFDQQGSDKGMIVDSASNYSVGTRDNLPRGVKFFGEGGKKGYERTRELFRRITSGTLKTFILFLISSFSLTVMPNYARIYAQEAINNTALTQIRGQNTNVEIEELIEKLGDKDWDVRIAAIEPLGELKDPRAVDPLIKALEGNDGRTSTVAEALVKIGSPAVDPLIKVLGNKYWYVRDAAAEALVKIGSPAVDPLIKALGDKDWNVHYLAAKALVELKDPRAVDSFIKALEDKDYRVRDTVAKALVELKDPRAVDSFIKALENISWDVRYLAAKALVELKDPRAVDALIKAMEDKDCSIRNAVAEALGELKDPRAVDALIKALENKEDWHICYDCAKALVKIGPLAVDPLINVMEDKNENVRYAVAEALGELKDPLAVDPLIKALTDKDWQVRDAVAKALVKIGSPAVIDKFRSIVTNELKYDAEERQDAKKALEQIKQRVSVEGWNKTAAFDIKKYLKPAAIIVVIGALLYVLTSYSSYIIAKVRATRLAEKQRNQDKGTNLYSFVPSLIGIALSGIVILGYGGYKIIKKDNTLSSQKKFSLPFFKTMNDVTTLRKSEKIDKSLMLGILRLGVKNRVGALALWMLGSGAVLGILIGVNLICTYRTALLFVAIVGIASWLIQSAKGADLFVGFTNKVRMVFRFLIYPMTYLTLANEYMHTSALTPEHFYLLRQFKKEQGERMFNEVRELAISRFGKDAQWQVLGLVIAMAYEMSKKNKDIRDLLEIQVPVAIEVSADVKDFKANLAVVEKILTGPYDIKLIKDKQKFKAFFEKVGKDLRPMNIEQTVETIGLLEHRLIQQGFDINHFYDEIFMGMDKQTLDGAIDIIFEIIRYGFFPTRQLINMAKATQGRVQLYRDWRAARLQILSGGFDINNPLHVELEYSTCRRILDNSRVVSQRQQFKNYSYDDYIRGIKNGGDKLPGKKERAEIIYAAYEAIKLEEFIDEVKAQANSFGREVWVVPNLSLGRFAAVFAESDLRLNGVDIAFAKIGSTEMHEGPFHIDPRFIRSQVLHRMISEKPVIIIVDASMHLQRYPDAHQGYLNLAIALDDVISGGNVASYTGIGGRNSRFINGLKKITDFKAIRKTIQREYDTVSKKDPALYNFYFWNPRGAKLDIRSSWITRRGIMGNPKPLDPEKLNSPAFIFVNTVLDDKDIPEEIKEKAGNIEHTPGYFDDKEPCKTENLLFKIDGTGIHLADNMHEVEMRTMANLRGDKPKRNISLKPIVTATVDIGKLTGVSSDFVSTAEGQNTIRIRRLIDELDDRNSKIRADAAAALGEYVGNETVAVALRKSLPNEKREDVRYWVASSLGSLGVVESVKDLSKALLNDSSPKVRVEAARALGKLGDAQAVPLLAEALNKDTDMDVKKELVFALRNIRGDVTLSPLLRVLKEDKNPIIRAVAAEAYLDVGREEVVQEALKCLNDKSELVRTTIAEGLGDLADSLGDLTKDVVGNLSNLLLQDRSPMAREKAAWALGQIGDIGAIRAVETSLSIERDNRVNETLAWARERLVKAKTATVNIKEVPQATLSEKKIPLTEEKHVTQEAVQDKIITLGGVKIDLSTIRGFIFDLDDTLAPLTQPVSISVNEKLIKFLRAGKYVAIITTEVEENLEKRLWGQIPYELRKNLYIYSNGGAFEFGFDDRGEKVDRYHFALQSDDRVTIIKVINSVLSGKPFSIKSLDYKVKIKLGRGIRKERRKIASAIQEGLKAADIEAFVSFQGRDYVNVLTFDKTQAARKFLSKCSLGEENVLIIANSARSFGNDRRLLTSFPNAVSINVGSTSATIEKENPNIIQTDNKNLIATEAILNAIVEKLSSVISDRKSYNDTGLKKQEDEDMEKRLNLEAGYIRQKYPGIRIGIIGATRPTDEYSSELGQRLGKRLRKYIGERGFIFTGGVTGVGTDVYKGIIEESGGRDDRFFALLPKGITPSMDYREISPSRTVQTAYVGQDMFERRIGMGKIADLLIVLNGGYGTLHETVSAIDDGKKIIVLNHGGVGALLYNAKLSNALSPTLIKAGLKPEHLQNIITADLDHVENAILDALPLSQHVQKIDFSEFSEEKLAALKEKKTRLKKDVAKLTDELQDIEKEISLVVEEQASIDKEVDILKASEQRTMEEVKLNAIKDEIKNLELRGKEIQQRLESMTASKKANEDKIARLLQDIKRIEQETIQVPSINEDKSYAANFVNSVVVRAREAKKLGQKLIIGFDTSWIPGYEKGKLQHMAMNPLVNELEKLQQRLSILGLDNVVIVDKSGDDLADELFSKAQSTGTPLSNIVVLASQNTIDSKVFDQLRSTKDNKKAFMAAINTEELNKYCVDHPEDSERLYIRIIEMFDIALELSLGKEPPKNPLIFLYNPETRMVIFLPRAEPIDFKELKNRYEAERQAIIAA